MELCNITLAIDVVTRVHPSKGNKVMTMRGHDSTGIVDIEAWGEAVPTLNALVPTSSNLDLAILGVTYDADKGCIGFRTGSAIRVGVDPDVIASLTNNQPLGDQWQSHVDEMRYSLTTYLKYKWCTLF